MTDLIFSNANRSTTVKYATDLLRNNQDGRFTVMQITGSKEAQKTLGLNFTEIEKNVAKFVEFAEENELRLERNDGSTKTVLVDIPE